MNAKQRRAIKRANTRRIMSGMLFATEAPPWSKTTADEILANCRRLLGYTPMADFAAGYELRSRYVWPRLPVVYGVHVQAIAALLIVVALLSSCAAPQSSSRPVCGPCIAPSSGPVYLDELQVRQLLAGVEREEGTIRAERDEALTGKTIAEQYADQVRRDAVIYGTLAATISAAVAAAIAASIMAQHAQPAVSK
jgi:hypothetical protein